MATIRMPNESVETFVLRVLRTKRELAIEESDPHDPANSGQWQTGVYRPNEYDYLSAERIAYLITFDSDWRTVGYEEPSPTRVLRVLHKLYNEDLVWTWGEGTPAVDSRYWALAPPDGDTTN